MKTIKGRYKNMRIVTINYLNFELDYLSSDFNEVYHPNLSYDLARFLRVHTFHYFNIARYNHRYGTET